MNAERNVEEGNVWLDQADGQLTVARLVAQAGSWWEVCHQSHRVAELSLKALAYYRGDQKTWTHSLDLLLRNVADTFPEMNDLSEDARTLNNYHSPTIYPDAFPNGSPRRKYKENEATKALAAAERIYAAVRGTIPPSAA